MQRLRYIDALRGWAVLGVIGVHSAQQVPTYQHVLYFGARGVQLFYLVSAITLMLSWHSRNETALPFLCRRFFRIAPMFWLGTIIYPAIGLTEFSLIDALATLSLLHALTPWTFASLIPGGSTIGIEVLFYLSFPLLVKRCRNLTQAIILLGFLYAISRAGLPVSQLLPHEFNAWMLIPRDLSVFSVGMICFFAIMWLDDRNCKAAMECLLVLSIILFVWRAAIFDQGINLFVVSFATATLAMSQGAGSYLTTAPIRWIGKLSFSCYVLHFAFLSPARTACEFFAFPQWASVPFIFLACAVMTLAASAVTYSTIERAGIRLGSSLAKRLNERAEHRLNSATDLRSVRNAA